MISHGNYISVLAGIKYHDFGGFHPDDSHVSFMPPSSYVKNSIYWLVRSRRIYSVYFSLCRFYNGDIMKFKDDMAFIKPTLFVAVPRILNRIVD